MNRIPDTRASLLVRLRQHDDADAWAEFLEIYQPLILSLALARGLQEADANEVVQEVLSRVAKAVQTWQNAGHPGAFRAWLSRVTKNLVIQYFRDRKRWPQTADQTAVRRYVEEQPDFSRPAADDFFDIELQRQVFRWAAQKSKSRFEPKTWQAFWQTAVENKGVEEVASELDMTRGAVYIARSRVMAQICKVVRRKREEMENGAVLSGDFATDPTAGGKS